MSAVSRLVSRRTCSSTSAERFCASSTMTMMRRPSACADSNRRFERVHHLLDAVAVSLVQAPSPSSSQMVSKNSTGVMRGFKITADIRMMRHARQQRAHHRRLAGAHFARQLNESARFVDAVKQMSERLGVPLAQIEVARIRGDRERLFARGRRSLGTWLKPMIPISAASRTAAVRAGAAASSPASIRRARSGPEYRRWWRRAETSFGAADENRSAWRSDCRSPTPTPSNRTAAFGCVRGQPCSRRLRRGCHDGGVLRRRLEHAADACTF